MSQAYNLAIVRELLLTAFTAEELHRFCQDNPNLRDVCRRFGESLGLDDMVDQVMSYVCTRVLLDELVQAVEKFNPRQYAQFQDRLILPEQKGNKIGEYEIVAEIGRGGMGVVYRAYQRSLDRYVAIKVLPPELSFNQAFLERFKREARAVAQLRHPNIVVIHGVGEQDGTHYLVMEFLEGHTLKDVIAESGPLLPERAARIIKYIASALDYAHQHGFVHRDVKPANIFIGPESAEGEERVTLTDFGIAKAIAGEASAAEPDALTRVGTLMGTPEYMSPEQAAGEPIDHCTDLYALGVVLYEVLTGRAPFQAPTPHAVLHQIIYEAPPQPRALNPAIAPALEAVVLKAIAKRPEERFQKGAELSQALRRTISSGSTSAIRRIPADLRAVPPAAPSTTPPSAQPSGIAALLNSARRSPRLLAGGVVAVLVLTAALLFGLLGGGPDEEITRAPDVSTATEGVVVTEPLPTTSVPTPSPSVTPLPPTDTPTVTPQPPTDTPTPVRDLPVGTPEIPAAARIGRLVFSSNRDGNPEIYVLDLVNGGDPQRLTTHAANDWLPDWSPDGSRIAFTSSRSGVYDAWVTNADGSNQAGWVTTSAWDEYPRWAPDGERLSFSSTARTDGVANSEIFVREADGSLRQITYTTAEDQWADWSPDGRLAYTEGYRDNSNWDIYISSADGSTRALWMGGLEGDIQPTWSPDGQWIAFVRLAYDTNGNGQIDFEDKGDVWVARVAGGGLRQLTHDLWASTPAWSPDGEWIAFAHLRDPNGNGRAEADEPVDILAVSVLGGDVIELVAGPYRDGDASWTESAAPTATPTWTPTATPVVPCSRPIDDKLAGAWDRERLGCPLAPASVTWAAWEPFERGDMIWLDDWDMSYAFVQTGSAPRNGPWQKFDDAWDGSDPEGVDMGPPAGLFEPKRGFGWLWRNKLGGPRGVLGWARDEEAGFCARIQLFDLGFILRSDDMKDNPDDDARDCVEGKFNNARAESFRLSYAVSNDGTWRGDD